MRKLNELIKYTLKSFIHILNASDTHTAEQTAVLVYRHMREIWFLHRSAQATS